MTANRLALIAPMLLVVPSFHASLGAQSFVQRGEQNAARAAMLDGNVMPFSIIKRRVDQAMDDATYLGSEFNDNNRRYRLKYVREGKVIWVDVDGRTGNIVASSR
jgi:hypothetical protein